MPIYYVTSKKPLSHNKKGSSEKYKQEFRDEFSQKYANLYKELPIRNTKLQSSIVYIHQLKQGNIPDVDNLSKPIVDTFTGVIFEDDSQIVKRSAIILELKDFDFLTVDATYMPLEIYTDFCEYYNEKRQNILLFEVDNVDLSTIKIGVL